MKNSEARVKRKLSLEDNDVKERSPVKKSKKNTMPFLTIREEYKHSRKIKQEEEEWEKYGHLPKLSNSIKKISNSKIWKTSLSIVDFRTDDGGYTARANKFENTPQIQSLEEGKRLGFVIVKSENFYRPITDRQGNIIAVFAPPPNDPSYCESTKRACDRMMNESAKFRFEAKDLVDPIRGSGFFAFNVGLSYGNGHTKPTFRDLGRFQELANSLLNDEDIQRLATYQDATYALWHPKAYKYYKTNLDKLWKVYPHLAHRLFPRSIMPTVAFNLGNRVATYKHIDSGNCPFGWCTITALGDFDASKGGHLVLWDLGIILEFPAGACVCLPSALIAHSNIPTNTNETRMSFTQYCSGEIFRHIENGFTTDRRLREDHLATLLFRKEVRRTRAEEGLRMFSTVEDLLKNPARERNSDLF